MSTYTVATDGACMRNPGPAAPVVPLDGGGGPPPEIIDVPAQLPGPSAE